MVRRRGLIRTAARTAVVAGTATSVSGRVARRQQEKFNQPHAAVPPAAPAARGDGGSDMVARLQQLADLRESGALSEKEFSAAKSKLLAS